MNFKTIGLASASLAAALVAINFPGSAQAFTLTGENTLALSGRARFDTTTGLLDFRFDPGETYGTPTGTASVTTSSSGRFASLLGQLATLKDITLTNTGGNVWQFTGSTLSEFVKVGGSGVSFALSSFVLEKKGGGNWIADLDGKFEDTGLPGFGKFDPLDEDAFTNLASNGSSYALDVEEIPTPALLPGVIGLGIAAIRKRKAKQETAVEEA